MVMIIGLINAKYRTRTYKYSNLFAINDETIDLNTFYIKRLEMFTFQIKAALLIQTRLM